MYIELSYPFDPTAAVVDEGIQPPQVVARSRMADGKRNNTSYIKMFAHSGTHIDVPWHFNPQGKKINDFPIDAFAFERVLVVDIPKEAWGELNKDDLRTHAQEIISSDALLIRTGFGEKYRSTEPGLYLKATPGLSLGAAQYLASIPSLRCIGVDFISIENLEKNRPLNYPVHHVLLDGEKPMILLEDAKLDFPTDIQIKRLFLFPLRFEELEASPVTAVAEIK